MSRIRPVLGALAALGLLLTAACSSNAGGSSSGASSSTLRLAFSADPAPLDPDTYYEAEGLQIMTATYQGLVRYQADSPELEGVLATDWQVSDDGLTYTFDLRDGVKFSDGTDFDSEAMKASFERRISLQGGPSYMLAEVASMETPDPDTFVVTLSSPVAPFLDYLASPYGPVAVSPTAVSDNAVDDDQGAAWLASHSAGTGPYELTDVVQTTKYELKANPNYWGDKPHFESVVFSVIPDFATQSLQLQGGQLDMVLHGLSTSDYESLASNDKLQIQNPPALFKVQVWVNPDSAVFGSMEARTALRDSIDRDALTQSVYGDRATPSADFYPEGMLEKGAVPDDWTVDASGLAALAGDQSGDVVVGYYGDNSLMQLANQVQLVLQDAGISASVRSFNPAQVFALPTTPDQRPDLLIAAMNPDAVHVDTWMSVYQNAAAPVNFLGCSAPAADDLAALGNREPDVDKSRELYTQAAVEYQKSLCWINIADLRDTIAARADLTGWRHELPWVFTTDLSTLTVGKG